jgi:hypothetical protein
MLRLGGTAVRRRPLLQSADDPVIDVSDGKLRHAFNAMPALQARQAL